MVVARLSSNNESLVIAPLPMLSSPLVRKMIESTLVSVDGVIGSPQVWAEPYFNDEAGERALEQLLVTDAMLMGRRTYEMFAPMWPASTGAYADRRRHPRLSAERCLIATAPTGRIGRFAGRPRGGWV